MKNYLRSILIAALMGSAVYLAPINAAPNCSSAATDSDADGWGWENNQSCRVVGPANDAGSGSATSALRPTCQSTSSDPDGDGWGWENGRSCRVGSTLTSDTAASPPTSSNNPVCNTADADSDGDGWGWENGASCRTPITTQSDDPSVSLPNDDVSATTTTANGVAICTTTASDYDGDGWGHEHGQSCRVTSATADADANNAEDVAPPPVAAASNGTSNGRPICLTDSSDPGHTGYGFENNRTCAVVQGVTATRDEPYLNQRVCEPWFEIHYGNYRLQNNTWASEAVYSNDWHQCIEVSGGNPDYVAKWDYNWLGRSQGDEFSVKSYPQVYYGRKTRYNISGSLSETGLPANINQLPQFNVHYQFSETGSAERNVALESFFHHSCEAEETNKYFELMVWVDKPRVRIPGPKLTTATISGQQWAVHVNPTLGWGYVAFVAEDPRNQGTLDWNAFVQWTRYQGPGVGVPDIGSNTCMGAIEMGTETFWGNGTFTLHKFSVTRN